MANLQLNDLLRSAMVDGGLANFDGGVLEIYDGTQPANANTAVSTQTLLASINLGTPAFNAAVNGAAAIPASISDTSANATGTATWFRIRDAADTYRFDGDITATAGGGNIELSSVNLQAGGNVTITSFTFTQPAA